MLLNNPLSSFGRRGMRALGSFFVLGLAAIAVGPAWADRIEAERNISLCSNENVVHARPRLCNDSLQTQTFDMQFVPISQGDYPEGPCSVDGPTTFRLTQQLPVLVPGLSCVDLELEIDRPLGMLPNHSACFSIQAQAVGGAESLGARSSFYDDGAICGFPDGGTFTGIPAGGQVPMTFSLFNTATETQTFRYRFESTSEVGSPAVLMNNSLAGGVLGQVEVPGLSKTDISVGVALITDDAGIRHDIVVRDLDSNAPLTSRGFRSFVPGCVADEQTLCLNQTRFEVKVAWRDFGGNTGAGHSSGLTGDAGYFWFFSQNNIEVMIKVLDGRYINDHWWVFFGALSTVEYTVTVRDTFTGESRSYYNPPTVLASVGDIEALPGYEVTPLVSNDAIADSMDTGTRIPPSVPAGDLWSKEGDCISVNQAFCVQNGRFRVEAVWTTATGSGLGQAQALTTETGIFWFFNSNNVELVVKVLDGRAINGHWWVFFGALSDVNYTVKVTDTVTGDIKTYHNDQGTLASVADIRAFVD